MRALSFVALILLVHTSTGSGCPRPQIQVADLDPFEYTSYAANDVTTMTCSDNYVVPWATAADDTDNVGKIKCVSVDDDADNPSWAPAPEENVVGFTGTISGCVACINGSLDCTEGTCNVNGMCDCKDGYKRSDDPRVCVEITCPAPDLSNQVIEDNEHNDGPYPVDAQITVTCTDSYHVVGKDKSEVQQVLTCTNKGFFDQTLVGCVVCADDSECNGGGTCTLNKLCECDEASHLVLDENDPTTCVEVTCEDNNPCVNNGKCSVKGIKLECECKDGTEGDTCADFTIPDVCADDPCNSDNGGTCARVQGDDVTDFNQHVCTCSDDKFSGDSCEFANNFFVWDEGMKKTGLSAQSVEFGVVTAKGLTPMYIALFKVIDQDDVGYKVLLLKPDDDSLQLHVTKIDDMSSEETLEITSGLSFTNTPLIVKVHIAADTKALTLTVGDESRKSITVKEITDFVIGGTGCEWDDDTCSFGKSRIFYRSFVGYFHSVSVDGKQQTYTEIKAASQSPTASTLTCADYTCPIKLPGHVPTCDDTSGQIACTCPEGYTGSDCLTYEKGMSFNGYTSDFTLAGTTVPVNADVQTATLSLIKRSAEVGEIATLSLFGCDVTIRAVEGALVEIGGNQFNAGGGVVELTFEDGKVLAGGKLNVAKCVVDTSPLSAVASASLGGRNPDSDSSVTLQDSRFKGCISKIVVNGIDIMTLSDLNTENDINTAQCTTDFDAPDPCVEEANPCLNNGECSVVAADNSAACECAEPYTNDAVCTRKQFCAEGGGNTCNTEHSTCNELNTIEDCNSAKSDKDELECGEDKVWYYYCACSDGWMGLNCNQEVKDPPTEAPVKDDGNDTTTIIIVVVVVAVVLGVVVTVIIVKKRKNSSGNGATNGKNGDSYSPQAQEKDLEMSGKIDEQPKTTNIYDNVDVIKNPNAESADYDTPPAPTAGPSAETTVYPPLDTADITVEPTAPEKPPSDQV